MKPIKNILSTKERLARIEKRQDAIEKRLVNWAKLINGLIENQQKTVNEFRELLKVISPSENEKSEYESGKHSS